MPDTHCINYDLLDVYANADRTMYRGTLAWGDRIEVLEQTDRHLRVTYTWFEEKKDGSREPHTDPCFIVPRRSSGATPADIIIPIEDNRVLRVDFVDVQQGDGSVIQTPQGKIVLVDGGENQLFARYLAGRFRGTSLESPKETDCIVITHGDADHFAGLTEIQRSETYSRGNMTYKRLFIYPRRVYHNGLIKRPSSINNQPTPREQMFGTTVPDGDVTVITELVEDITTVDDAQMNRFFKPWKRALLTYKQRYEQQIGPIDIRRLEIGNNDRFAFLADEGVNIEVLGPIPYDNNGIHGLRYLGEPPEGPHLDHESLNANRDFRGLDPGHTINGHSIVFRLTYGNLSFLYTGDLNNQSELFLLAEHNAGRINLQSDILKAPHHGSADFSPLFLHAVAPVISIVSSGDENARTEHIHPRATLMGALGRYSRTAEPLIFVTELVAFFKTEGFMRPEFHRVDEQDILLLEEGVPVLDADDQDRGRFFAFSRAAFGSVRVRSDGQRLLIYTDSGKRGKFEAYAYTLSPNTDPTPTRVRKT